MRHAVDFYRATGKRPQVLAKEIAGFVANRLQAALFRGAVNLVVEGVMTEPELDAIVADSIGLRWAAKGPFETFHLGGGEGGFGHFLEHLAPIMEIGCGLLGTPSYDEPTKELLLEQAAAFGSRAAGELERERDQAQLAILEHRGGLFKRSELLRVAPSCVVIGPSNGPLAREAFRRSRSIRHGTPIHE